MKNNWQTKKLGEVCEIGAGNSAPQKKDLFEGGKYPFFRTSDVGRIHFGVIDDSTDKLNEIGIKKLHLYKKGTLLLPKSGASTFLNHRVIMATNGYVSSHLATLKAKDSILDDRFLFYFSSTIDSRNLMQDQNYPSLRLSDIQEINILLPPFHEQRRIVEILAEVFEKATKVKENAGKNLQNARELFESYLKSVFANPGDGWEKVKLLNLLERGWITSHLDGNHGGEYPRKEEFKKEGIPYISANCLKGDIVDLSLAKFLSPERAAFIRKGVAINKDVLFAHNATVGPVALLKTNEPKVILGTSLTYYRCNPKYILPEYLIHYMRSGEFKLQYELIMRQSTRNQVPITKQREFYHLIPPVNEQNILIQKLDALFAETKKLESIYQQKLIDLDELKKSILQKAFTGELAGACS